MALVLKDRVKETTTTTGTGTYTLAGAVTGFEAFSSVGDGNTTYYACTDGTDFEVGIGTYTSSGTTLARTTILQSSNSDSAVSWSSGTRTIFCTQPAEKAVFLDGSGNVALGGDLTASGDVTTDEVFLGSSTDHKIGKVNHTYGDGIGLTTDSGTVTIGQANSGFVHYVNSNAVPHWFNQTVYTNGHFGIYSDTGSLFWLNNRGTSYEVTLTTTTPTAARTITLPDASGEAVVTDSSGVTALTSTTDGGAILKLVSDDPSDAADWNVENEIQFFAENDASESVEYANIRLYTADVSDGTEDGWLYFQGIYNGTLANRFAMGSNSNFYILGGGANDPAIEWNATKGTSYDVRLKTATPTADRTITLPDATGTVALTSNIPSSGISSGNVATFTSGAADNDFLRIDGTAIEGRSASEVLSDIGALGDVSDDTSPTLGGNLSTGGNQIQLSQTSGVAIQTSGNLSGSDLTLLRASGSTSGQYGFDVKYMGSRSGNNNSYSLFMHNQTGTDVEAITVLQDGKVGILNTSPGSALDVTGEIAATSLDISGDVDVDGTLEADAMTLDGTAITTTATLSTGISNNNVPKFTSGVADNDFLRVDGTAIEGRSASEVLSDIAAMPLAGGTFTGDVTLTDTDAGSGAGPLLALRRNSSSPADNDALGRIQFNGENDADENIEYAAITGKLLDNTDGTEDGGLILAVCQAGSTATNRISMQGYGDTVFSNKNVRLNTGVNLKFEGATENTNETTLTVTDPTADRTITLPDATGTVQLTDGSGASLTSLNASELGSGTVPNARLDAQLQDVAGLAVTNGNFIVGDGSNFVAESGATARTSLGLGTAAVLDTGISNTNVPKFTSGVADDDFLRVNGTDIEGRSAAEVLSDIAAMPLAGGTFTGDVTLQQSDDGSSEDPQLILNRVSSSPADNDTLGTILFRGRNDAGEVVNYAKISSQIADASDGTEDGYLNLQAPDAGSLNNTFLRIGGGEVRFYRDTLFLGDNYTVTWDKSEDTLEFADNAKLAFGAGDDISLHWDGTDGHLAVAGTLNIEGSGETLAKFIDDGAVELYHNNSKKLETASGGVSVTGEVAATSLDISGDVDVDGTLEADAITVNGTALNTVIADESTALAIALG